MEQPRFVLCGRGRGYGELVFIDDYPRLFEQVLRGGKAGYDQRWRVGGYYAVR
jgi:hypothetical protein